MKRPEDLIYAVDEWPPWPKLALLGLQQVSLTAIYLVLLIIVVREADAPPDTARSIVSFGMLAVGVGAVLQAVWKGPVGSGFLAPPVLSAMYLQASLAAAKVGGLPLVYGMTVVAGLFEAALSRFLHRLRKVFPPVVSGVIVAAVGFEVGLIGLKQLFCVTGTVCHADFPRHLLVATVTLAAMVGFSVWGRGLTRLFCSLLGIILGLAAAAAMGLISAASWGELQAAPLLALPHAGHLSYSFKTSLLAPFLVAGLAAGLRTIGVITTCQQINDAEFRKPDLKSIKGGVLADGLGCALSGALGATGLSTAPSAVGVSKASGATSRYIGLAVGAWFAALACFPKLAAVFLAFSPAVVGPALVFTGSLMLGSGIQLLTIGGLNPRKTFIIGISLLLGLSHQVFPDYFQGLRPRAHLLTGSLLAMATIAAVVLNLIFRLGIRRTASISLEMGEGAWEQMDHKLRTLGSTWGVEAETVRAAAASLQEIFAVLRGGLVAQGPVTIQAAFDDLDLTLEISYRGSPASLTPQDLPGGIRDLTLFQGVAGVWRCLCPDPVVCASQGADCRIRLVF